MWTTRDLRVVLVAVWLLDDELRREALREDGRRLHQAFLTNFAMADTKALNDEQQQYLRRLGRSLESPVGDPVADARAQIAAMQQGANGD